MASLTDYIEDYLKKLLALSGRGFIEIRRREIAGKFSCVPSQVNYVLQRRFTPERGYIVESRRGGSGCIRLYRLNHDQIRTWDTLQGFLGDEEEDCHRLRQILDGLGEQGLLSRRERRLLGAVLKEEPYRTAGLSEEAARRLQKRVLGEALRELLKTAL